MPLSHRDRRIWLFNAADYSGNPKWLLEYVMKYRKDITAYWVTNDAPTRARLKQLGVNVIPFSGEASARIQRRAGVFVVNQVKEKIPTAMTGIVLLNLWHGVGVKSVERRMTDGFLLPRIATKYIRNNKAYRDTQLLLVSSPAMEAHFATQIGFTEDQVIRAGYPQNTYRRVHGAMKTYEHDVRSGQGVSSDTRVLLYAPTYRLADNAQFIARALPDMPALLERLESNDQVLILKMHPQLEQDRAYQELKARYSTHPRLIFWEPGRDVYEVFGQVDTAIVDYSSIHYDLLAAGVTSFIRYAFDLDEPTALEPSLNYLDYSCGAIAADFDALLERLGTDNTVEPAELERLREFFWAYDDDESLERIVQHALEYEVKDVALPTLYSFDIFDTLIHRRSVTPGSIHAAVRQEAERSVIRFPATLLSRYVEIRMNAERAVRESRRKDPANERAKTFEITFNDIFARLAVQFDLSEAQVEQLQAWELQYEYAACIPDDENVARALELLEAGETVVLISDMYLPKDVIRSLLAKADERLSKLPMYLSSDFGVQKSTKELYVRVFVDLSYDFAEWIHTGDNGHADVAMAGQLGITTNALETPSFYPYEKHLLSEARSYDAHLLAGLIREVRLSGASEVELFAYRTVSLYLVPYVNWLLDDAVARGYEMLYFISRDGHHLKRIADVIIETRGLQLETAYIFGSRRAWRLASQSGGIDDDTFAPHGSFGGIRTFASLVETSRLGEEELLLLFPEFESLRSVERFDAQTAGQAVQTLSSSAEYRARLAAIAETDREITVEYLRQEIALDRKIAFAEYWGRGYTQDCLVTLLADANGSALDVPFYYARSIYPSRGASIRHNFTSASYSLLLIEAIFANLPYGTTTGYRRDDDDRVVPVSAAREYSHELLEAMEKMLPKFAAEYVGLDFIDPDRMNRDAFRFGFEHFRAHPTNPQYVNFLAPLRDAVELGSVEREFAPKYRVVDFIAYLRGKPVGEITRSLPLSLARATGPAPTLLKMQMRIGFRRVFKRIGRWLSARVPEPRAAIVQPPSSNPPIRAESEIRALSAIH